MRWECVKDATRKYIGGKRYLLVTDTGGGSYQTQHAVRQVCDNMYAGIGRLI